MYVNLTPAEYDLVREVADYYGSKPAPLAHEAIMRWAAGQYSLIKAASGRDGILGRDGSPPAPTTTTAVPTTAPRASKVR